jgi:hypothetical protein
VVLVVMFEVISTLELVPSSITGFSLPSIQLVNPKTDAAKSITKKFKFFMWYVLVCGFASFAIQNWLQFSPHENYSVYGFFKKSNQI